MVEGVVGYAIDFLRVWKMNFVWPRIGPNVHHYHDAEFPFKPLARRPIRELLGEGGLVIRLEQYPVLFRSSYLSWLTTTCSGAIYLMTICHGLPPGATFPSSTRIHRGLGSTWSSPGTKGFEGLLEDTT